MVEENPIWFDTVPDKKRFDSLKKDIKADVVVIGGGIVGVSTAYFLSKRFKTVLLEKNHIGTGDSGYTTAFLTRTPDASSFQLSKRFGQKFLNNVFLGTRKAEIQLFENIKRIKCDASKCSSYFCEYNENKIIKKEWKSTHLADKDTSLIKDNKGLGIEFNSAIRFKDEGKFNIRKYLFGLLKLSKNLSVFEETEVLSVKNNVIKTPDGNVKAKKIVIAIGDPSQLFPLKLVSPIVTYVIALDYDKMPLSENIFWDTFDPYYYYRTYDRKTLILGGCDGDNDNPYEKLEKFALQKFGKGRVVRQWSGTQYKTKDDLPYIFEYKKNLFIATGFNGSGMVFGTLAGMIMTDLCLGKKNRYSGLFSLKRTKLK